MEAITLITAVVGAVTGILALLRDRAKIRLSRRPFDEERLRQQRPDLRQSEAVSDVPLDLSKPFFCLSAVNVGSRPITVLEAHAAFYNASEGVQYEWNTHWFRSVQTLQLFDRNTICVLDETQPMAKFIYPAKTSPLLALTITTPGKTYRYFPSRFARWTYRQQRRKWRRVQAARLREEHRPIGSGASERAIEDRSPRPTRA